MYVSRSIIRPHPSYSSRRRWFQHGGFLRPILRWVVWKFRYFHKSRYTSFQNFVPNSGPENFAMAKHGELIMQTRRQSSLLTTPTTVDVSWLDTCSLLHVRRCDALTPLLWFVVQLVPPVVQQLTRFRLTQCVARSVCGSRASCHMLSLIAVFQTCTGLRWAVWQW